MDRNGQAHSKILTFGKAKDQEKLGSFGRSIKLKKFCEKSWCHEGLLLVRQIRLVAEDCKLPQTDLVSNAMCKN